MVRTPRFAWAHNQARTHMSQRTMLHFCHTEPSSLRVRAVMDAEVHRRTVAFAEGPFAEGPFAEGPFAAGPP